MNTPQCGCVLSKHPSLSAGRTADWLSALFLDEEEVDQVDGEHHKDGEEQA